ncbi:MAG: hypothetical protein ACTHY4_03275 [Flavobacteriaceae bacterium]
MNERMNERKSQSKSTKSTNLTTTTKSNLTINYVTDNSGQKKNNEKPKFTGDSTDNVSFEDVNGNVTLPIFFGEYKTIQIPKGVRRRIKRLPKGILKRIDSNKDVAVEKCLIMTSNLTYTVFNEEDYWKSLSSTILHDQFKKGSDNTFIYKEIIEALKYETNSTHPIIECKKNQYNTETYRENYYTKQYRLDESCRNKTLESYQIKHDDNINKRKAYYFKQFNEASANEIGKNLIKVYEQITLPSKEKILIHAKKLVKENHKNKKGKKLTFLNKKSKSYFSNLEQRSFVEDNLKLYDFLVGVNFMIPKTGDFKSGGRVVDSFNLMPSWIRSLIKIEDENICELDFKALHPNIALSIYGNRTKQITHEKVAEALELPLKEIKIEHLSFFNKRIEDMKKSILYGFYNEKEKEMIENLKQEKLKWGYKKTSQRLFKKEVNIMTDIISQLNKLDIYVLYVYDALYCKQSDNEIVTEIMNRTIKRHGVFTNIG